jgi:CBS domain containing-hemolysin-like protein
MLLLFTYVMIALGFSFLCSIAEAVLLSVSMPYVTLLEKEGKASGKLMRQLKGDVNRPLAAILTLNTIAHTIGAAGAGAQATAVFGDAYLGVISAILTLLILVFSEIIPKTLGAHYWRQLAPATAYTLRFLIWLLYPFVVMSEKLTKGMAHGPGLKGFSREEFAAMAELGAAEGELARNESKILRNLFLLRDTPVKSVMTPRTVAFLLSRELTVSEFHARHSSEKFSRIPIYQDERDHIIGFVLRTDLLLAQARNEGSNLLSDYARPLLAVPVSASLFQVFEQFLEQRSHIMMVVDEYGALLGLVTLEDILETLLGLEIVDESDKVTDMQILAQRLWQRRARNMGLQLEDNDSGKDAPV